MYLPIKRCIEMLFSLDNVVISEENLMVNYYKVIKSTY